MKLLSLIRGAAVAMATLGMMIPNAPAIAAGQVQVKTVDAKIFDISLSKEGAFKGRVVDHTGSAIEGAEVTIKQDNKEVARTVTDKSGSYSVSNLKGGVYSVASGATEGTYRVWTEQSAPPAAKEQSLLVLGENGARGNFGYFDDAGNYVIAGVAIAALTVAIVALVKINQNKSPNSP